MQRVVAVDSLELESWFFIYNEFGLDLVHILKHDLIFAYDRNLPKLRFLHSFDRYADSRIRSKLLILITQIQLRIDNLDRIAIRVLVGLLVS